MAFLGRPLAKGRPGNPPSWRRPSAREENLQPNMIGAYGSWAASLAGEGPGRLSFLNAKFAAADLEAWRAQALARLGECLLSPEAGAAPPAQVQHQFVYDGL